MADKLQGDVIPVEPGFLNYVQRETLGVVGQIVPWNFPLMFCRHRSPHRRGLRRQPEAVQLELGGKGANIVFDDAFIPATVNGSAFAIFHNKDQACIAGSRLLLHEKIADQFLDAFLTLTRSIRLGDPLDP